MPTYSQAPAKPAYIICPSCGGSGRRADRSCGNCRGLGVGAFQEATFVNWGQSLTPAAIEAERLKAKTDRMIDLITLVLAAVGLLALAGWFVWSAWQSQPFNVLLESRHPLLFWFWLTTLADCFLIYRLSRRTEADHRIRALSRHRGRPEPTPNNWAELNAAPSERKVDAIAGFGYEARRALEEAYLGAYRDGRPHLEVRDLFLAALFYRDTAALFSRLGISPAKLIEKIRSKVPSVSRERTLTEVSLPARMALVGAYLNAAHYGQEKVDPVNWIQPCLEADPELRDILDELEIDPERIANTVAWMRINERLAANWRRYKHLARFKPATAMDRAYTAVATPLLNRLATDLTRSAKWGRLEFVVGRDKEFDKIFDHWHAGKNGVILIGPEGAGKRAVIEGLAQLMVEEDVPKNLRDKRLLVLDIARLVAGATVTQAEERLLLALSEIERAGNILLAVENLENLFGLSAGGEQSVELSEVLLSVLERRNFLFLATATDLNHAKYIEGRPLGSYLGAVAVAEPEGSAAVVMVESKIAILEAKYRVYFAYQAIETAVKMSAKYMHDQYLPAKAITVLESTAVLVSRNKGEDAIVTAEDVAGTIAEITHIPAGKLSQDESQLLLDLEELIHARMVDQSEAVKMVASAMRRARAELQEGKRPIASFLFLGPTGVGKTELARTLAEVYFGNEKAMIRLDMSEYQLQDSVPKMIGDQNGVLGYLTEAVRRAPFALVLLDELEKAHPDVLNLFLQVMEDGRLTDGQGRTIDFTNAIIIATANAGAGFIQEKIFAGVPVAEFKEELMNTFLFKNFRPEFINRFDGVIVFEPLSFENVVLIAERLLGRLGKILLGKGIGLESDQGGIRILARDGFDPQFGARPLRRILQERVEDTIANKLLSGELKRRDTVVIDHEARIGIRKAKPV